MRQYSARAGVASCASMRLACAGPGFYRLRVPDASGSVCEFEFEIEPGDADSRRFVWSIDG